MAAADDIDVAIIGGGQAGLATSHELTEAGIEHVVLEQGRVGETWRTRWESFCLVTPNWSVRLPGHPYDGDEPDGFMPRDEIVAYLERYAAGFGAPVREGIKVTSLAAAPTGGFLLRTADGEIRARSVVVATGAYQRAHRPEQAASLPADLPQIDVQEYRSPAELPPGSVLVVGSGQSGCQIAEELREAGREVFLACGRAPWSPRRIGGRDLMWWGLETGFFDQTVDQLPAPAARLLSNVLATGRNGGHDLHLRTLRAAGVTLLGHFLGADGRRARFADDLAESVAWGDSRYQDFIGGIRQLVAERGLPAPDIAEPAPFDGTAPQDLDLAGVGVVIFAGGFRPDYGSWIDVPRAFDELGFPLHVDGASSAADGLYFVGVHFLRTRKSSLLWGVGEDAAVIARQLTSAHSSVA
jgi:putative flavoprotein involved in K+ transport